MRRRRRSRRSERLAHKVVESPFLGGGERAATAGRGLSPAEAEEEPPAPKPIGAPRLVVPPFVWVTSADGKLSSVWQTWLPARPFQVCTWTVLFLFFWRNYRSRKIAQVGGVVSIGCQKKNFFFLSDLSGSSHFLFKTHRPTELTLAHSPAITPTQTRREEPSARWGRGGGWQATRARGSRKQVSPCEVSALGGGM